MSELNEDPIQNTQSEDNAPEVTQTPPPVVQTPPVQPSPSMFDRPTNHLSDEFVEKPKNNLTLAIIATVVSLITCCGYVSCIGLILGIVAIVLSTQVDTKYKNGDFEGAENAAKYAKILSYIALGTVAVSIIWIIIAFATTGTAAFLEEFNRQMQSQGM